MPLIGLGQGNTHIWPLTARFIEVAEVPNLVNDKWVFPNPTLDALMAPFQLTAVYQAFPAAEGMGHPLAEPLSRVYAFHCDCDSMQLYQSLVNQAGAFFDLVEPPTIIHSLHTPNDYQGNNGYSDRWHLDMIHAEDAWDITTGEPDIQIAIVEPQGFYVNHEDLVDEISYTAGTMSNGLFTFMDHGTHVASMAAASTNNGKGLASIGYNCKLMLYQGTGKILDAAQDGANIINCSWGVCSLQTYSDAIQMVQEAYGAIVVAGAGNGNDGGASCNPHGLGYLYPASLPGVISVSSVSVHKRFSISGLYHTHNDAVDIVAPGFDVAVATPFDSYGQGSGTSFASPLVAGVVGLMLSVNPCLTPEDVTEILQATGQDISSLGSGCDPGGPVPSNPPPLGWCNVHYYGGVSQDVPKLVDAAAAVQMAAGFGNDEVIVGTEVWSTDRRMTGNLTIPAGARLILTAELRMPADGYIFIERGGRMEIDGGIVDVVTSPCRQPWGGIQVWGNANVPHPSQNHIDSYNHPDHGVLITRNGAQLRNARTAVSLARYEPWGLYQAYAGGIIQAEQTLFENNRRAAEFVRFEPAGSGHDNASSFEYCTFRHTNGTLFPHDNLAAFVSLWRVHGVDFIANTFLNQDPADFAHPDRGVGLYSLEATYTVRGFCTSQTPDGCGTWVPTRFIELDQGIRANGPIVLPGLVDITQSEFLRCREGVSIAALQYNVSITHNYFELPADREEPGSGLYLNGSRGFQVEANTFTEAGGGTQGDPLNAGIRVNNGGAISNEIYRNQFEQIRNGIFTLGQNRAISNPDIGLQIKCNTFQEIPFFNIADQQSGLPHQGFCVNATTPAGNLLSHDCLVGTGDFDHPNSAISDIEYRHHDEAGYQLQCYSTNTVSNRNCQEEFDALTSCPNQLEHGPEPERLAELAALDAELAEEQEPEYKAYLQTRRQWVLAALARTYLQDQKANDLLLYLASDSSHEALRMRISLSVAMGLYSEAQTLLESLQPQSTDETQWKALHQWVAQIRGQGRSLFSMNASEEATLRAIATSGEPSAVAAQVYLELVFGEKVPFPYDPLPISGLRAAAPDPDAPADWARLYPNPATKHLQVQLAGDYLPAELVIRDMNGQTVSEVSLSSPSTKVDLSQLPSGLFHVEIMAKPDRVYQQKVVILK
ncbi:MAG: T9SS C-terminal target domain-containing protein [Bacteroidetes bacterium]|nr:MAG: T9SS C-terminal target domain-containing protein [Bacteroidota bacterium]